MSKAKSIWQRLVAWLLSSNPPVHDGNPFQYIVVRTAELEIGDYLVAYDGYIQRIGPEGAYTGARCVVTKKGHNAPYEFIAKADEEFTVRIEKEVL